MRKTTIVCTLYSFMSLICLCQSETRNGYWVSPRDTLFVLNIFIHIDYDLYGDDDPLPGYTPNWPGDTGNTINQGIPVYLEDFMDREFNPNNIQGRFTQRFAEASFNNFIVLGDFIVVNISQSRVGSDSTCYPWVLMDSTIAVINENGGLQTIYGHDSINFYDRTTISYNSFYPKPDTGNGKIDILQFFVRNSTKYYGKIAGGGQANLTVRKPLLINGGYYTNDFWTISDIRNQDLSSSSAQRTEIHELGHALFGGNEMHMGGGGPVHLVTRADLITLSYNQGGWSLMSSANSSLISCSGFDRWRLDWRGPDNLDYRISCQGDNSDLEQDIYSGQTFYLRDFVTTGDAIRIKLPYTDPDALAQYIWLENHQIHANGGKEDYPTWWDVDCRSDGTPGIYAYYQVGKDALTGSNINPDFVDHLIPISAEGKWDISLTNDTAILCINSTYQQIQNYDRENPLSGYNDLMSHFFDPGNTNTLNWYDHSKVLMQKRKNGIVHDSLCSTGDAFDAFTNNTSMNMSTNPAPFNVVTYHHERRDDIGTITKTNKPNNRKIHLTGLKLDFLKQSGGIMRVDVQWDYYEMVNSVLWTGDIVLHEELNLQAGKKITFDQNQTPNTHTRNTITGVFADPTYFTCLDNSEMAMQAGSEIELNNMSSFILESGSSLEIFDNSVFTVKEGCTFVIEDSAELKINAKGRIEIQDDAYICIEPGASIHLSDPFSTINMRPGYQAGVNSDVLSGYNCTSSPLFATTTGDGEIHDFYTNLYIQNETINTDRYYAGSYVSFGKNVTTSEPQGEVFITSGTNVIVDAEQVVLLDKGFTVYGGASLEIR